MLSTQLNYAQSEIAQYERPGKMLARNTSTQKEKSINNYFEQSQAAMQRLRKHILANIEYPELMESYGIEDSVVIEVTVSDAGKIEERKILKSISQLFDKAVLDALQSLDFVIDVKNKKYQGARKLHLSINFSLR